MCIVENFLIVFIFNYRHVSEKGGVSVVFKNKERDRERNACNVEVITETEIRIHHINTTNVEMMSFYNIFLPNVGQNKM